MESQYEKFLDMIYAVRINIPLIDVLAGMPNYGKFLKELISNKRKIKQIYVAFLSDESSAMIQNKVPPKLVDPGIFLIPCNFNKTFSCNALADLGASINLMSYSLYAKLSLETLKPTKMRVRLADKSFQYPIGIAENILVEVGKFTFHADFVILEMEEDSKVPLILGRPFFHTVDAIIRVKHKQLNLGVRTKRMIFNIDSAMKHPYSNDDTCFGIDVIDEILEEDFDVLLEEGSKILHSIEGTLLVEEIFVGFDEFIAMTADENSNSESNTEEPPFEKITINTNYKIKTSLEEPPTNLELKPFPDNLEHIQLMDDKKPVIQKQRRLNPNMQEVVKKDIMKLLDSDIIYPIADSPWVSHIYCELKKGGITVVTNENDELVPTRTVIGWRVCIDYRKLNEATAKDHFSLPFMDQISKALVQETSAKPRLILWILLLQEFDIEIKDRKGSKNVAADHLFRIKNDEISDDSEVDDNFPRETLMEINTKDEPWFADFANYLVGDVIPKGMTYQQKNKFFSDLKHYFSEEPYLFKVCSDSMIKRYISGAETRTILDQCHHEPIVGHYGPNVTAKKVLDSGFYWPTIIKEAHTLVLLCEACQKTGNISKRDEMPLNNIQVCEIFDIWGIDFMGPFLKSYKFEYILVVYDYVSKWAEAQALPTNNARVVVTFLKKLFCRSGMPKALISDRVTHFCNKIMERTMKRYVDNHRFSTSYHPQTSGQVENTNRALKRIIKKTVKDNPAIWSRKVDTAL
nr:reverse transcriptase domain-containing protein [Tanacetum cinerariifolium]